MCMGGTSQLHNVTNPINNLKPGWHIHIIQRHLQQPVSAQHSPCRHWGTERRECIPAAETVDEALLRLVGPVAAVAEAGVDWRAEGAVMLALA